MQTAPTEDNTPKNNPKLRQKFQKTSEITGHRKGETYRVSKSSVWNTQKEYIRGQNNCRSVGPKQMHPVPNFQDVNHATGPAATSKAILDDSTGPKGWVLAYSNNQEEKRLSRFPLQGQNVAFSCPTFWPQYWPKNLYEINSFCRQSYGIEKHLGTPVLGRPLGHQCDARGMFTSCQNSNISSDIFRLDPKPGEISARTSSNLRLVRSTIRPYQTYGTGNSREIRLARNQVTLNNNIKILHKKTNHANSGPGELYRQLRPTNKSSNVKNKSVIMLFQNSAFRCKNSHDKRHETQPDQMGILTTDLTTTRKSNAKHYNPNRCLPKRLGISNQSKTISRRLRSNSQLFNQHTGTVNSMVRPNTGNREACGDPSTVRQRNRSSCSKEMYVYSIPPSNDFRSHLETSNVPQLETINCPYRRTLQCPSGSTIQKHRPINRMVFTPQGLSKVHTQRKQVPPGRPLCNESKSPTGNVHFTLSRSESNSSGCNDSQLGEVESPISVSTLQHDFEGFGEDHGDEIQHGNSNNSRVTNTTVVHGATVEENTINSDTSTSSTISVEQADKSNNTNNTSRLEIIKAAYRKKFTGCDAAIDLMAEPLRPNSRKDYQHKWECFISFLNKEKIPLEQVTVSCVLRFLTFLFHQQHFKPGTVAKYKTALTVPLKEYFNVDLKDAAFSELLRAMWLQRPNKPNTAPAWSLNKVLTFIDQLREPLSETLLLRKTAFLLLLATGWRVSELHACVRNREFCRFSENSTLIIRPHPSFLAKNERPHKRWSHKEIKVLKLADGSISNLCPVKSLKEYLRISSDFTAGALLLAPGKHQVKLSIHQLSTHICSLILQADKTTARNVHDIRTYATSCALAETMLVGELISAVNWSSPAVFYKFYLTQTEPLTRPVSLPVQRTNNS